MNININAKHISFENIVFVKLLILLTQEYKYFNQEKGRSLNGSSGPPMTGYAGPLFSPWFKVYQNPILSHHAPALPIKVDMQPPSASTSCL